MGMAGLPFYCDAFLRATFPKNIYMINDFDLFVLLNILSFIVHEVISMKQCKGYRLTIYCAGVQGIKAFSMPHIFHLSILQAYGCHHVGFLYIPFGSNSICIVSLKRGRGVGSKYVASKPLTIELIASCMIFPCLFTAYDTISTGCKSQYICTISFCPH